MGPLGVSLWALERVQSLLRARTGSLIRVRAVGTTCSNGGRQHCSRVHGSGFCGEAAGTFRAWKLWEAGQQLDLLIDGQIFAGSFIKRMHISSSLPTTAEILLPIASSRRL